MIKPRILIADDDKLQRQILQDILEEEYDVVETTDGNEAIAALNDGKYVAVLSDHMMPGVTGVEVLARALACQPDAVRILITATDDVTALKDAINVAHVHRFLVKPVRELELPKMLKGAIRESRLERENARLVVELRQREKELEHELTVRTQELKEIMEQMSRKPSDS